MGTVISLADIRVAGTRDPARLALLVKVLSFQQHRNTAAQAARLAAAQRLLGGK